ncbi:MAG: ATP-binding protein [Gammaproteobacteria bacterium]|nr:ATP-binding protein [Gammaproteobacteria bacterium]
MKQDSWTWSEEDLLQLITSGTQENLELDYKRCDSLQKTDGKKSEISKDVSAFANSAGGVIVYGMLENGHIPTELDIGFDPDEITKEWLEQVINSRIHRRVRGIRINQILLNQTNPGKVAYVVHIPQSNQAPHQASDKRFYKRYNFESVPMEEYEIRDVATRDTAPDLEFTFRPGNKEIELQDDGDQYYHPVNLVCIVSNLSQTVAQHAVYHLYIDSRIALDNIPAEVNQRSAAEIMKMEDQDIELTKLTILWDNTKPIPLFAGLKAEIPSTGFEISIPKNVKWLLLRHTIGAPGMVAKDEFTSIIIRDGIAKLKRLPNKEQNNA